MQERRASGRHHSMKLKNARKSHPQPAALDSNCFRHGGLARRGSTYATRQPAELRMQALPHGRG